LAFVAVTLMVLRPPFCLIRLAARWRPDILFYVPTGQRLVALTLDDGPDDALTGDVLDVLGRHDARATFFVLGHRAQARGALIRRIVDEGHEVGNHGWTDTPAWRLSQPEFERQLLETQSVLRPTVAARLFRPGSGWIGRRKVAICERHGYRCVLGSLYPYDAHLPLGRLVADDLVRRTRPGAILLLHEGDPSRRSVVDALDALLAGLRRRGFEVLSVADLSARTRSQG
jgi:peptidoglycan/xylan/chitin deacetylase (PgdA/CDA1 family)